MLGHVSSGLRICASPRISLAARFRTVIRERGVVAGCDGDLAVRQLHLELAAEVVPGGPARWRPGVRSDTSDGEGPLDRPVPGPPTARSWAAAHPCRRCRADGRWSRHPRGPGPRRRRSGRPRNTGRARHPRRVEQWHRTPGALLAPDDRSARRASPPSPAVRPGSRCPRLLRPFAPRQRRSEVVWPLAIQRRRSDRDTHGLVAHRRRALVVQPVVREDRLSRLGPRGQVRALDPPLADACNVAATVTISYGSTWTRSVEPDSASGRASSSSRFVCPAPTIGQRLRIDASVERPDNSYSRSATPSVGSSSIPAIREGWTPPGFRTVMTTDAGSTSMKVVVGGSEPACASRLRATSGLL